MEELAALPDNWNARPDNMLGESVSSSYLSSPRRKKRASWIGGYKAEKEEVKPLTHSPTKLKSSWVHLDDETKRIKEEETPTRNRNANSVVAQKMNELRKQNDDVHAKNEKSQASSMTTGAKSSDSRASTETTESTDSLPTEAYLSPEPANKEKIVMQRSDITAALMERPTAWLGGEGEAVELSYLRSPKTKLKASWTKDAGEQKEDQETKTKAAAQRRMTSPGILQKLSEFSLVDEDNHAHNERLDVKQVESAQPRTTAKTETSTTASNSDAKKNKKIEDDIAKQEEYKPVMNSETVHLQRSEIFSCNTDRPDAWFGGEGEVVEHSYLKKAPKTKRRTSWLQNSSEGSQSLRDVTAGTSERMKKMTGKVDHLLSPVSAQVQETCPSVAQKLCELSQKNIESHEKNDGLAVEKKGHAATGKKVANPSTKETSPKKEHVHFQTEKISLQRPDHSLLAKRPEEWMGGEGEAVQHSYLKSPKTKLRSSWMKDGTGSQSMRDVFTKPEAMFDNNGAHVNMNASDSNLFTQHEKNDSLAVHKKKKKYEPTREKAKNPDAKGTSPKKEEAQRLDTKETSRKKEHVHFPTETISLQRPDHSFLVKRPEEWMGGEGERVQHSYLTSPKTKLRSSWMKDGTGSQSMRDVFTKPEAMLVGDSGPHSDMNASDSNLFTSQRRKPSSMVMEKLLQLNSKNEENHKRNEELTPGHPIKQES